VDLDVLDDQIANLQSQIRSLIQSRDRLANNGGTGTTLSAGTTVKKEVIEIERDSDEERPTTEEPGSEAGTFALVGDTFSLGGVTFARLINKL